MPPELHPHTALVRPSAPNADPWRASAPPLYQTATFAQESAAGFGPYDYTRTDNPTRALLESELARLEGGARALTYASGMGALAAVLRGLAPGQRVLASEDLYGGTLRLLESELGSRGVSVDYAPLWGREESDRPFEGAPDLVLVEGCSNPLARVADVRGLARRAHAGGGRLCVDNTALSPLLLRPLELGADLVVHSATKWLGGHGDLTAGVVACGDARLAEELASRRNADGSGLAPFEAWLLARGLKTLAVRLERSQASAQLLAERLEQHPAVRRTHYAGLSAHPECALLRSQAQGAGALVSFETGDVEASLRLVDALSQFTIAVSFGGVSSQASLPCRMSHASVPAHLRRLPPDLVRLSVGLEHVEDLWDDLAGALDRCVRPAVAVS